LRVKVVNRILSRGDQTQILLLAKVFVSNLKSRLKSVDLIIPMPPSKHRSFQPIVELAKVIANKMELLFFDDILVKSKGTVQMKDNSKDLDRIDILKNSFVISDEIEGDVPWDALIIDDVYSTGSSLNAAAMTLQTYQKIRNIYVAAFSRTKKS
jgi:predicted amidophosphoribosyltransferase